MNKIQFEDETAFGLESIDEEEDLKPKDGININPPPNEMRCDCCRRPLSELEPFSDFDGDLLRKTYRPFAPYNGIIHKIYDEFFGKTTTEKDFQKAKEKLTQKYGEERAERIVCWEQFSACVSASLECRDCICLNDDEFYERSIDNLDPPERCDCCGRHLGELKPFTEGDPVASYFKGKLLARRYRPDVPPNEGVNKMMNEFFEKCLTYEDHEKAQEELIQKCGREEAFELYTFAFILDRIFIISWECKDCIVLATAQYFKKKMAQEPDSGHDSPG